MHTCGISARHHSPGGLLSFTGLVLALGLGVLAMAAGDADAECRYLVNGEPKDCPSAGCSSYVSVTARGDTEDSVCGWDAKSEVDWIQVGPSHVSGSGTVKYSVLKNPSPAQRSGKMIIAGQTVILIQAGSPQASLDPQPASLSFTATAGGPNPPSQTIGIKNGGAQGSGMMAWQLTTTAQWAQMVPSSGQCSDHHEMVEVKVTVSPIGVRPGTYPAVIRIVAQGALKSPVDIPLTLTVTEPAQPTIVVSPTRLGVVAAAGSDHVLEHLRISNGASGSLEWQVGSTTKWLTFQPTSGTSTGEADDVTVRVEVNQLRPGSSQGVITVAARGASNTPLNVPISVTIEAGPPPMRIDANPTSISLAAKVGDASPTSVLHIRNGGSGTMTWRLTGFANWLSVAPTSGSTTAGETDDVTVSLNTGLVRPGTFNTFIVIDGQGAANSPLRIPVTVTVKAR